MPPIKESGMNYKNEDRDPNGNARSNREMPDGTMFYGSNEEYSEEMEKHRDEAKS